MTLYLHMIKISLGPPQTVTLAVTNGNMSPYTDGTTVMLTCTVTGANPPATTQWRKNGSDVTGETGATLIISMAAQTGDYTCAASNSVASDVTSNAETLTIRGLLIEIFMLSEHLFNY